MALLLDGLVATVEDITHVDSGIAEVARAESISIDHKLNLAQRDCELRISQFVVNHGLESRLGTVNNVPRLDRILVTDSLRRWFGLHALQLFYSDAYYSVLNDRYGKKFNNFYKLAAEAWEAFVDTGIACVFNPIPRGKISGIEVNAIPIGAGTYYVAIAWVDSMGNSGSVSEVNATIVAAGEGFTIIPGSAPNGVAGYDVYASLDGETLRKQNDSPLGPNDSYSAAVLAFGDDRPTPPGQNVDFVLRKSRMFTRG